MKFLKIITIAYVAILTFSTGCISNEKIVESDKKIMPKAYKESIDTFNTAEVDWKAFFADKYLIALIDTALKNNYDLLMTLQKIEIARNDLRLSKGALLPTVNANFSYLQRKFGYYTMDDAGNRTTEITPGNMVPTHLPDYFIGLQTNWEIDVWGKLQKKKKSAFSRYLGSLEGTNLILTNLISEIAQTYYELIALDNELTLLRESIKLQNEALEIVKIQKEAAVANELAVKQFEAQVLNSQALEFKTLQNIVESENKINFLLGRFPQAIEREKTNLNQLTPSMVKIGNPAQLLMNRPDIRQAEFELVATKFDVKAAKAAFYPTLNINGWLAFQSFKTEFLLNTPQSLAYSLLGSITTPLLNRSAIKAQFKNAKASQIEAMYNYQKTILNAYMEVSNEFSRIQQNEKIHQLKLMEVEALWQSNNISSELFKSGKASYFEVLMIQNKTLQSNIELIEAKKQQFNSTINIYKALGGGWK